jgi:hypothetical protein
MNAFSVYNLKIASYNTHIHKFIIIIQMQQPTTSPLSNI